jgi:hypothetical protein
MKPASYWYLRGFDIVNLEQYLDWFNIMTYDIRKCTPLSFVAAYSLDDREF